MFSLPRHEARGRNRTPTDLRGKSHRDRCLCLQEYFIMEKDETCVLHFHFLSCLWFSCMVVTIVVTVSHAGSLSGSCADLLSVASWQTSDKDGGEISHVCHRSDGVISSNLAQSDVAEKIYQLGFVYEFLALFFSWSLTYFGKGWTSLLIMKFFEHCSKRDIIDF